MSSTKWNVTFRVYRQKGQEAPHYDDFQLEVDPDEYVLDGVERIWAFKDRTLVFRHACHHSTCGACGMRVNGVEKLTCITYIRDVTTNGGTIRVDPLRNFPVMSDLSVDMTHFYRKMEQVNQRAVLPMDEAEIEETDQTYKPKEAHLYTRLSDCIECGLCISACPVQTTSPTYLGPAVLAGAQQTGLKKDPSLMAIVDHEDGAWRCHSVYACTAVCPSYVEPAWRIMDLRKQVMAEKFKRLFGRGR